MSEKEVLLSRLEEALKSASMYKGSLVYAASFTKAACAFNAFLNLLPDLNFEPAEKEEVVGRLQEISQKARSSQLHDFAFWTDDVRDELVDERRRRLRNHW
ncbi:MAG: hypothetical protein U9N86_11420 [Bacteroidota bacterium]|nr:hypothetical protein [Bacteroidota bacterium]